MVNDKLYFAHRFMDQTKETSVFLTSYLLLEY